MKQMKVLCGGVLLLSLFLVFAQVFASNTIALPKTGQTASYAVGDDGAIQTGISWPNPRLIDNNDGTVTDTLTGLVWLKNANCFNGLTWANALTSANTLASGSCGLTDGSSVGQWHMPGINEIDSLADISQYNPALPIAYPFNNIQSGYYWSSTSVAYSTADAFLYLSNGGNVDSHNVNGGNKSSSYYLWPVRSAVGNSSTVNIPASGQTTCYDASGNSISCTGTGQDGELQKGISWSSSRFLDNNNQTITDTLTQLIWSKDANAPGPSGCSTATTMTWQAALGYVACLNSNTYLGYTDWRLPDKVELQSLVNYGQSDPSSWLNSQGFSNVNFEPFTTDFYWSSSTDASSTGNAWIVILGGPILKKPKTGTFYAWPVRGGINPVPTISGTLATTLNVGTAYSFTPSSTNATSFSITGNIPGLTFDTTTGTLSGTPTTVGTYKNIVITATNASGSTSLPPFTITVAISGYIYVTQWGTTVNGNVPLNARKDIATDNSGNIYLLVQGAGVIQKFDNTGNFILQWSDSGAGVQIWVDKINNYVYATSGNQSISKYYNNGTFISQFGSPGSGNGQLNDTKGIATDSKGNVYVSDGLNNRIQKFDSNGNFIAKWGIQGSGNGQFINPKGIAIDINDNVYVVDNGNYRIQKFDSNGNYLMQWGSHGNGNIQFSSPFGIAIDSIGNIFVTDAGSNNRIIKFDSNGNYLTQWGTTGSGNGQFQSPIGVAVDSIGNIFVVDNNDNRIQKFSPDCSITGTPPTTDSAGNVYSFVPSSTNAATFSISGNIPSGLTFNSNTGSLTGTPLSAGTYDNIVISVNDGHGGSASLPAFSIIVASSGGTGGGGTPVPVMDGLWLLPGVLAGFGLISRRRKQ